MTSEESTRQELYCMTTDTTQNLFSIAQIEIIWFELFQAMFLKCIGHLHKVF